MMAVTRAAQIGLIVVALLALPVLAGAEPAEQPQAAPAPQAQAQANPPAKAAPASAPSSAPLPERVTALEKQSLVLTEDIGKARLETRTRLEELAKRQAEQIERLNRALAEQRAQAEAEQEKQRVRNQRLWIAVGVLALGVIASN